ncbi:MAG: Dyp-type peroxidase [Deltaproteobacteria bacterium]|nr:Dyp-type peroxidase [Deltaproteobacteria bacterium]
MSQPQGGILPEPTSSALFLILRVRNPAQDVGAVLRVSARVPALVAKVAAADRRSRLVGNIGIGSEFWEVISPAKRPKRLRPFNAIDRRAPNTGGDVLLHIISRRPDLNFELAMRIMNELGDTVDVIDEVHGFRYLGTRDLTGFLDGTENPKGKQRAVVALIGEEDPDFAGGSYVFTQRYVHDLKKWATVPLREQEGTIGRRKKDSKQLTDKVRPATAHISRVVIEEHGEELQIVRHSFPYGTLAEAGLFFIAYTKDLAIPEKMLSRMLGTSGDDLHDHLMDFTRAVSGATFFAPSLKVLRSLALHHT